MASQYCSREDLYTVGVNRRTLDGLPETQVLGGILDASAFMDGYLGQRYTLPLVDRGDRALVMCCASIAAFYLLSALGFDPEGGTDRVIVMKYENAEKWLKDVVANRISPQITDSSPAASPGISNADQPMVISGSGRGLSSRQSPDDQGFFYGD